VSPPPPICFSLFENPLNRGSSFSLPLCLSLHFFFQQSSPCLDFLGSCRCFPDILPTACPLDCASSFFMSLVKLSDAFAFYYVATGCTSFPPLHSCPGQIIPPLFLNRFLNFIRSNRSLNRPEAHLRLCSSLQTTQLLNFARFAIFFSAFWAPGLHHEISSTDFFKPIPTETTLLLFFTAFSFILHLRRGQ